MGIETGDGLLIRVRRDHQRLAENLDLLQQAVKEERGGDLEEPGPEPPTLGDLTLSWRARCYIMTSRLAWLAVSVHIVLFACLKRVLSKSPRLTSVVERTSTGCLLLWRGNMCEQFQHEQSSSPGVHSQQPVSKAPLSWLPSSVKDRLSWARQPALRLVWLLVSDVAMGTVLMTVLLVMADDVAEWLVSQSEVRH